ncbi:MAG: aminoacetone oxidase family FAD-binding enzyme, partial [Alphaproteobacteria bacterium]|nr:aminoacetone oxidase family FAD-binding enzyme [Alphaproteobacteria bacterium]
METFDVIIAGAGAAGMMCAIEAGKRGRRVLIIDHAKFAGEKIRISGGGRCNFTNVNAASIHHFLSNNPRFAISALQRYKPKDFIALVERYGIAYHEKTLGQLFCDVSSRDIVDMLRKECELAGVEMRMQTSIIQLEKDGDKFIFETSDGKVLNSASFVVATGGPSIPKMGASRWGYEIADYFGLKLVPIRAALVPFTLDEATLARFAPLSGIATDSIVKTGKKDFREGMLFTHRGLSGPAVLQISSYCQEG